MRRYIHEQLCYLDASCRIKERARARRREGSITVGFRIPAIQRKNIENYCKEYGLSLSDWLRLAIHNELDRWNGKE